MGLGGKGLDGRNPKDVNLTKTFGGLTAVSKVNFSIQEGDLQSIIGPNGAGKSTFFKLDYRGDQAQQRSNYFSEPGHHRAARRPAISHRGIAVAYQITNIFPMLSVFENVRVAAQSRKTTFNLWSKAGSHNELTEESRANPGS